MKDIETLTKELGEAIQGSKEYLEFHAALDAYNGDDAIAALAGEFNLKKMAVLNEMKKEDKDDAKVSALQDEMRAVYSQLISHPLMIAYNEKKEAMEAVVNKIYDAINFYVTGEEPHQCSGSCSTCGGCH